MLPSLLSALVDSGDASTVKWVNYLALPEIPTKVTSRGRFFFIHYGKSVTKYSDGKLDKLLSTGDHEIVIPVLYQLCRLLDHDGTLDFTLARMIGKITKVHVTFIPCWIDTSFICCFTPAGKLTVTDTYEIVASSANEYATLKVKPSNKIKQLLLDRVREVLR